MARTKREASKNTKKESKSSSKAVKDTGDHDLKSHIRALGGDVAEDYELLKNADSDGLEDVGNIPNDVSFKLYRGTKYLSYLSYLQITLLTDVSKFMKSLEFGSEAQSNPNVPVGEQSDKKTKGGKKLEKPKQPSNDKHVDEKPNAKIAVVTAKVIQSSKSNKTKFVRQSYSAFSALFYVYSGCFPHATMVSRCPRPSTCKFHSSPFSGVFGLQKRTSSQIFRARW